MLYWVPVAQILIQVPKYDTCNAWHTLIYVYIYIYICSEEGCVKQRLKDPFERIFLQ